jgi:hypothetical protein
MYYLAMYYLFTIFINLLFCTEVKLYINQIVNK